MYLISSDFWLNFLIFKSTSQKTNLKYLCEVSLIESGISFLLNLVLCMFLIYFGDIIVGSRIQII